MISAILLAAGESKRMGQNKQLLPLGKSTMVAQAVDNLLGSAVGEVIVVTGYMADEVEQAIREKPVRIVNNPMYEQGMSTSIIAGLNSIDSKTSAVMLALGDQPYIDSRTIDGLIETFADKDKGVVIPVFQGRRGHPVIFDIKYKDELLSLKGDIGGREIIQQHPEDVVELDVDCEGVCIDIDTIEHYRAQLENGQ